MNALKHRNEPPTASDYVLTLRPMIKREVRRLVNLGVALEREDAEQESITWLLEHTIEIGRATNPGGMARVMVRRHLLNTYVGRRPTNARAVDISHADEVPVRPLAEVITLLHQVQREGVERVRPQRSMCRRGHALLGRNIELHHGYAACAECRRQAERSRYHREAA